MNKNIVYISDFFLEDVCGGAELNDAELISMFLKNSYSVFKIRSNEVTVSFLNKNKNCFFIVSNFINLSMDCRNHLTDLNYIIYEHDHKYLKKRNPSLYKDFKAPKHEIVNYFFYKNARKIICQSSYHKKILVQNLSLKNVINISGNLWSKKCLEKMRKLSKNDKQDKFSILDSRTIHKNTAGAIKYCLKNNLEYELVKGSYTDFLESMSKNSKFVFLPKSPETLSRVIVEARMLNCSVVTNQMVGATYEPWFQLKGEQLIDYMLNKRNEIFKTVEKIIDKNKIKRKRPLVSIVSTFFKGEKFLEGLIEDIVSQTIFDKCELILVDTASPGREKEIINKYTEKYPNIRYYRFDKRKSPTVGTNIGLMLADSRYVTIANIDDRRSPEFLEESLKQLSENKNASLIYSDCIVTNIPNEKFVDSKLNGELFEHSLYSFSKENMVKCLPGPMPFWDTAINEKCGFFHENYKFANDWEMWLRAVKNDFIFYKNKKILGLYLAGGRSDGNFNLQQRKEEAEIFFKFSSIFGENYQKYYNYFDQFRRIS